MNHLKEKLGELIKNKKTESRSTLNRNSKHIIKHGEKVTMDFTEMTPCH